jgi:hypothetical protein
MRALLRFLRPVLPATLAAGLAGGPRLLLWSAVVGPGRASGSCLARQRSTLGAGRALGGGLMGLGGWGYRFAQPGNELP